MELLNFIFKDSLTGRTVAVKASAMRYAMHGAAKLLGIKEVNLIFVKIEAFGIINKVA